jgi:cytochrome c biogenesis protein ResB
MDGEKTEEERIKEERIQAERAKAAQALEEEQPSKENLAYFDAKLFKKQARGFSKDPDAIIASAEKFSEKGVIFAPLGLALSIIGRMGGIVTELGHLGLGGVIISGIPSCIGTGLTYLAGFLALATLVVSLINVGKSKKKIRSIIIADLFTIAVLLAGHFLKNMI